MRLDLFERFYFHGVPATEIEDSGKIATVIRLGEKLKHLENNIMAYESGRIDIMPSGNIFISGFPRDLADDLRDLLS